MSEAVKWNRTISDVNDGILANLGKPHPTYYLAWAGAIIFLLIGAITWGLEITYGMGITGKTSPVYWGVLITDFVFWVGIGHAGTLISAILFLFRAKWRNTVNRSAEAMTVFAVITAGLFPLIHVGRLWVAMYWIPPLPNTNNVWSNLRSPLAWDLFAISTYLTISLLFWYMGLVPDLASIRDRVKGVRRFIYGIMCFGWRGTAKQWHHYEAGYGFLAALATPLVLSVHSIVSWDFAMSIQPGWHTTIFPPYFVAGAILSGCAMVYTLLVPVRKMFRMEEFIRPEHLEACIKLTLLTSTIVFYAYGIEFFVAWYSGNVYEWGIFEKRAIGPYAFYFWVMVFCNCIFPMIWWSKRMRNNIAVSMFVAILVNVGMWFERYNIIVSSLAEDFLPGSWGHFQPSLGDICLSIGSFGWFMFWFLIFCRFFPIVSMSELKLIMPKPLSKKHH
ncbi:MAG TPA: NrfD/PsrC family molybdoenzyme membrane anchor subunit [Oligoflexus sp.]|uniref:NrfD/PsrC family molybdoenzyme membrane anchor subunit n=1 Tax=Oligoflexus sp. TaxID=1971216 RepID=UPI002D6FC01C|nr:NrfD/PsrC family molybdoenzyme membrane anchor subunit [Oligoflexus sp.]HYX39381.1 NrfD/PsrC family molybdoenzyme membrane anchor subunit [Oligoflexus sp.]